MERSEVATSYRNTCNDFCINGDACTGISINPPLGFDPKTVHVHFAVAFLFPLTGLTNVQQMSTKISQRMKQFIRELHIQCIVKMTHAVKLKIGFSKFKL